MLVLGGVFAISANLDAGAIKAAPLKLVMALCLTTLVVGGLTLMIATQL